MDNIRPWCVSRQLWWGHQIPVWYCPDGHQTVATETPDACAECGSTELERDPDVLDTWFSSALWPFATLGWPEPTERLAAYYPGHVLVTARDIINLWVARMLMMGLEFMGERPFSDIYITSIIQAPDGRRMSKSLGTGINPLDLIDRHGADGTRYGLLKMSSTQDVRFAEGMIDEGAKLANKLWNASRFVLLQTDPEAAPSPEAATIEDQWILSRLCGAQDEVLRLLDAYEFAAAVKALYAFIWNDFCDWYVEAAKARLYGEDAAARRSVSSTLLWVLERTVALAHPVLPFVTEEIWGFLPGDRAMLLESPIPEPERGHCRPQLDDRAREDMEVVSEARRLAGEGEKPEVRAAGGFLFRSLLERVKGVVVVDDETASSSSVAVVDDRASLEEKLAAAIAERDRALAKLANEGFASRAPAQVVDAEREKAERYAAEVEDLERRLSGS
jgi:valyl-tRNA synthetase